MNEDDEIEAMSREPVLGPRVLVPAAVVVGICALVASGAYWASNISNAIGTVQDITTETRELSRTNAVRLDGLQSQFLNLDTFRGWTEEFRESNPELKVPRVLR